jgi:hypothetical protein
MKTIETKAMEKHMEKLMAAAMPAVGNVILGMMIFTAAV